MVPGRSHVDQLGWGSSLYGGCRHFGQADPTALEPLLGRDSESQLHQSLGKMEMVMGQTCGLAELIYSQVNGFSYHRKAVELGVDDFRSLKGRDFIQFFELCHTDEACGGGLSTYASHKNYIS